MTTLGVLLLAPLSFVTILVVWNMLAWSNVRHVPETAPIRESLSILIPARNEESNIGTCIKHALDSGKPVEEILIYDDHSDDATPEIVQEWASRDPRVRLIEPVPLPDDWYGKPFACAKLAEQARGDWLLFIDADTRLTASATDAILQTAQKRNVSFLACWPKVVCVSFWEKTLMPMLNFAVFTLFPACVAEWDNRPSLGIAHGACILVRRLQYERLGGHRCVKQEIFEDTALARAWRKHGEQSLCLDGQNVAHVRMYKSFGEIWFGFQKNFYPAFRQEVNFWLFLCFHTWCFLLPFVLLILPRTAFVNLSTSIAASVLVFTMRLVMAFRFHYPLWSCLLHPFTQTLFLALGVSSWWKCHYGSGVVWKGRKYLTKSRTS